MANEEAVKLTTADLAPQSAGRLRVVVAGDVTPPGKLRVTLRGVVTRVDVTKRKEGRISVDIEFSGGAVDFSPVGHAPATPVTMRSRSTSALLRAPVAAAELTE